LPYFPHGPNARAAGLTTSITDYAKTRPLSAPATRRNGRFAPINVVNIEPGAIATAMDATYVTGTTIFIDGGLMRRAGSL